MMLITKKIEIDMAHRVPNHKSKCQTPHGHRYVIEIGVDDKVITQKGVSDEGMVIDFGDLKEIMMKEIDTPFDHSGVFWSNDVKKEHIVRFYEGCYKHPVFVDFIPTAENLSRHWYEILKIKLQERNIKIKFVKVWETPTATATYEE